MVSRPDGQNEFGKHWKKQGRWRNHLFQKCGGTVGIGTLPLNSYQRRTDPWGEKRFEFRRMEWRLYLKEI